MSDISDKITVFAAAQSGQKAYQYTGDDKTRPKGGYFSQTFADGLKPGGTLQDAFTPMKGTNLNGKPGDSGYTDQNPVQYGPDVSKSYSKGTAILVEGQARESSDTETFQADTNKLRSKYEAMGYNVHTARNMDEFSSALEKARLEGKNRPDDMLAVHYTGHGEVQVYEDDKDTNKPKAVKNEPKTGLPESKFNNPNQIGVLEFGANPEMKDRPKFRSDQEPLTENDRPVPNYVTERDFMGKIARAGTAFDKVVVSVDACHAGAIDNKQFVPKNPDANSDPYSQQDTGLQRGHVSPDINN